MTATAQINPQTSLTVTIVEHPAGFITRVEHEGATMFLSQDEAVQLYETLAAQLGERPVKV